MTHRVPIGGLGIIGPGALGVDAFRNLLLRGASATREVTRFDTTGLRAHCAALVDFNPRDFIPVMKMRRMNTLSRLGFSAAKLALDDRGDIARGTVGVAMGTAFGSVQTSVDYLAEYVERGPALASPQLFAESVANAPGSHIAIEWGLSGFNMTFTQRESSVLAAAMYGCAQLLKGTVTHALIGGVEEANEMLFSVLDRLRALAHGRDETARPFDRNRNGFTLGEGAAVLVAGPTADPYAWFAGFGMSRDTTATLSDWGEDAGAAVTAMRAAIDDAGITMADIDAVYASANGSIRGDRLEIIALQRLFGADMPPIVATKGYFGEYAAAGGLQLAAAVLAIADQELHATCGFETADPTMTFEPMRCGEKRDLRYVLVNTLSAGGGIVSAVIARDGE